MRNLREYFRPATPEEAIALKERYGKKAVYLAGGSDLLVHRPAEVVAAIDIRHCGLDYVGSTAERWRIGGAALLRDVERSVADAAGGMLRDAVRHTAPWLVRNSATLAGNIANASPAADSVPALLALDAELVLSGTETESVPLQSIFQGPHLTSLGDRLIREIRIPRSAGSRSAAFIKLARSASDIALVNVAVRLDVHGELIREARIALGAVAPVPMRALRAESFLRHRHMTAEVLDQIERAVREEVRPISDWRASAEYRRRMSGILVRRALEQAMRSERSTVTS